MGDLGERATIGAGRPGIPRWARAADAVVVLLVLLAAAAVAFGGARFRIGPLRVSATSEWRLLLAALAVLAVRHAFVRRDALWTRAWRRVAAACGRREVRLAWTTALASRAAVLAAGFLAVVLIGYPAAEPPFRVSADEARNLLARWDSGWYLGIAAEGYSWSPHMRGQQNIAFFPAYPLAMRVASSLAGPGWTGAAGRGSTYAQRVESQLVSLLASGLVISVVAFGWALVYLYRLARQYLDDERAAGALLLVASYPFAIFYGAVYTESVFLLGVLGAFYHFERRELLAAGAWGLLVGLTRPNGCFLSVPLAVIALQRLLRAPAGPPAHSRLRPFAADLVAAAMPGIGMLLFSAFLWQFTGNPFEWMQAHRAWGRTYRGLDTLGDRVRAVQQQGFYEYSTSQPIELMNASATLLSLAVIWPVARRFGIAYAVFVLVNVVPPLTAGGFLSMGRVTSVMFPTFLALAAWLSPGARVHWVMVFAVLQGLCAALFFSWRPLY